MYDGKMFRTKFQGDIVYMLKKTGDSDYYSLHYKGRNTSYFDTKFVQDAFNTGVWVLAGKSTDRIRRMCE